VNEVFLRVNFLRRLVPNLNSPLVGLTHSVVIVLFVVLIGYFNAREWHRSAAPALMEGGTAAVADGSRSAADG